eukprot:gene10997-7640_t
MMSLSLRPPSSSSGLLRQQTTTITRRSAHTYTVQLFFRILLPPPIRNSKDFINHYFVIHRTKTKNKQTNKIKNKNKTRTTETNEHTTASTCNPPLKLETLASSFSIHHALGAIVCSSLPLHVSMVATARLSVRLLPLILFFSLSALSSFLSPPKKTKTKTKATSKQYRSVQAREREESDMIAYQRPGERPAVGRPRSIFIERPRNQPAASQRSGPRCVRIIKHRPPPPSPPTTAAATHQRPAAPLSQVTATAADTNQGGPTPTAIPLPPPPPAAAGTGSETVRAFLRSLPPASAALWGDPDSLLSHTTVSWSSCDEGPVKTPSPRLPSPTATAAVSSPASALRDGEGIGGATPPRHREEKGGDEQTPLFCSTATATSTQPRTEPATRRTILAVPSLTPTAAAGEVRSAPPHPPSDLMGDEETAALLDGITSLTTSLRSANLTPEPRSRTQQHLEPDSTTVVVVPPLQLPPSQSSLPPPSPSPAPYSTPPAPAETDNTEGTRNEGEEEALNFTPPESDAPATTRRVAVTVRRPEGEAAARLPHLTAWSRRPSPTPIPSLAAAASSSSRLCAAPCEMRLIPATKFFFTPSGTLEPVAPREAPQRGGSQWTQRPSKLRIRRPCPVLGVGGMRVCFECEEVRPDGVHIAMVAKRFLHEPPTLRLRGRQYLQESEMQNWCIVFARRFQQAIEELAARRPKLWQHHTTGTREPEEELGISALDRHELSEWTSERFTFLPSSVLRIDPAFIPPPPHNSDHWGLLFAEDMLCPAVSTPCRGPLWVSVEPKLPGFFTKYNSNYGRVYHNPSAVLPPAQAAARRRLLEKAEAFSHFTLADSGGQYVVCDLQGVGAQLTDPQIHSADGQGFGRGNMGRPGVWHWVGQHRCNRYCSALCLPPLRRPTAEEWEGKEGMDTVAQFFHGPQPRPGADYTGLFFPRREKEHQEEQRPAVRSENDADATPTTTTTTTHLLYHNQAEATTKTSGLRMAMSSLDKAPPRRVVEKQLPLTPSPASTASSASSASICWVTQL